MSRVNPFHERWRGEQDLNVVNVEQELEVRPSRMQLLAPGPKALRLYVRI